MGTRTPKTDYFFHDLKKESGTKKTSLKTKQNKNKVAIHLRYCVYIKRRKKTSTPT